MALALDSSVWMQHDRDTIPPPLGPRDCHLWLFSLDRPSFPIDAVEACLADDERERARRFHFDVHRRRFISGRGQLRLLLARYTDVPAEALSFVYGPQGKPRIVLPDTAGGKLEFNLSHTEGFGLLGVTMCGAIGVDIEAVRAMKDAGDVARDNFSPEEVATWEQLPPDERSDGFFACWTRKEAIVKALGGGLSIALDSFQVTLGPGEAARLTAIGRDCGPPSAWTIWGERVLSDFWAAAAIRGPGVVVQRFCLA